MKIGGKVVAVHRLAAALAGMRIGGMRVLHECDNPPCCDERHLRTGTQADNMADRSQRGRWKGPPGGNRRALNGHAKLTERQVEEIKQLLGHLTQREIARRFQVSRSAVSHIATGRNWKSQPKEE